MKINKKSSERNDVTFSIVFSMIFKCRRKDGINLNNLSIRIKRKVLSTLRPLDEASELSEFFKVLSFTITSYMLMTTIMESNIL